MFLITFILFISALQLACSRWATITVQLWSFPSEQVHRPKKQSQTETQRATVFSLPHATSSGLKLIILGLFTHKCDNNKQQRDPASSQGRGKHIAQTLTAKNHGKCSLHSYSSSCFSHCLASMACGSKWLLHFIHVLLLFINFVFLIKMNIWIFLLTEAESGHFCTHFPPQWFSLVTLLFSDGFLEITTYDFLCIIQ